MQVGPTSPRYPDWAGLGALSELFPAGNAAACDAEADLLLAEQGSSETVSLSSYSLRAKHSPSGQRELANAAQDV